MKRGTVWAVPTRQKRAAERVMLAGPPCPADSSASKPAGTMAVSWIELTKVVNKLLPFHSTTEVVLKLVPLTVKVKPGAPSTADFVLRMPMVGPVPAGQMPEG